MKKIISLILLLCMVLALSACGKTEITMQEIYDAGQNEAMLKNHESVYARDEVDGALYSESYLTEDYIYVNYIEYGWAEFLTDDTYYDYYDGGYARVLPISPDGIVDIASYRAKYYTSILFSADTVYETIESVSKKDGRITVTSFFDQEALGNKVEGLASGRYEYVLDEKTLEVISYTGDDTLDDGTVYHMVSEVSCDAEAPEMVKVFLEYANQTEDLRNVTVVTNPGAEQEISQSIQAPKGLFIGFCSAGDFEATYELYSDAACTEPYDLYEDADSDLTIYVKWVE